MITCDEIIEETENFSNKNSTKKTCSKNFNEKKVTCKTKLLITIALSIAVSIYHYPINIKQNEIMYYDITSQVTN